MHDCIAVHCHIPLQPAACMQSDTTHAGECMIMASYNPISGYRILGYIQGMSLESPGTRNAQYAYKWMMSHTPSKVL